MIIIKLKGGLGNQLFQYSTGYALARDNNCKLYLDSDFYFDESNKLLSRKFDLSKFNIKYSTNLLSNNFFKKLVVRFFKVEEVEFYFSEIYKKYPLLYLEGYFQSEKYFVKYREELIKQFILKDDLGKPALCFKNKIIDAKISVSIHVRRGDYLNISSVYKLCELDYYVRAINFFLLKFNNVEFFLFSDDIDWCKLNLANFDINYCENDTESYEELHLMSFCNHNIIANSSFSWWGAWLNTNENKIVVAPEVWFSSKLYNTIDLIPSSWVIK